MSARVRIVGDHPHKGASAQGQMKRVLNLGRWRIAFLYGYGPYRWGFRRRAHGFDAGLRGFVLTVLRRSRS